LLDGADDPGSDHRAAVVRRVPSSLYLTMLLGLLLDDIVAVRQTGTDGV